MSKIQIARRKAKAKVKVEVEVEVEGVEMRGEMPNAKCQISNVKWLVSNDKGTSARPLLAVIGPVFPFRGLLSSVSGLVYAVCGLPSSSQ